MDTTKLIKRFIIFEAALMVAYFAFYSYLEERLPVQLKDYILGLEFTSLSVLSQLSWWLSVFSFILYVVAVLLLLGTKPIGKWLYAATVLISLVAMPGFGHVIVHSHLSVIGSLGTLTQGVVLTLLFFTKSEFNKHLLGARPVP